MKRLAGRILTLVMVVSLCTAVPVFAATAEEKMPPLTPTEDMTWGDVARYFDPEGYESLPEDIQRQLNSNKIDLSESAVQSQNEIDSTTDEEITAQGTITSNSKARGLDLSGVLLTLRVGAKKAALTYTAELSAGLSCPYMYVGAFIFDAETNKLIDFDSTSETNTKSCKVSGTFEDLESKHEYRVYSSGVLTPPDGYSYTGVAPAEITKETK